MPGYASPIGIDARVRVVVDTSIEASPNLVAGANEAGKHLLNTNLGRDYQAADVVDVALAEAGYTCVRCGTGTLGTVRGIEMGHVFRLGLLYSEAFDVHVLDEAGMQRMPIMGCYGLGVDRVIAGAVQEHHDERGIIWPASIAPFDVHLVGLGLGRDEELAADAASLYEELTAAGLEVLFDDRDESPGVKFNDADLLGIPLRVTASTRNHKAGTVEVLHRAGGDPAQLPRVEVVGHLVAAHRALLGLTPAHPRGSGPPPCQHQHEPRRPRKPRSQASGPPRSSRTWWTPRRWWSTRPSTRLKTPQPTST